MNNKDRYIIDGLFGQANSLVSLLDGGFLSLAASSQVKGILYNTLRVLAVVNGHSWEDQEYRDIVTYGTSSYHTFLERIGVRERNEESSHSQKLLPSSPRAHLTLVP